MKESTLQRQIIERLRQMRTDGEPVYWLNIHGNSQMRKGTPDLLVVYGGVPLFIELKVPGGVVSRLQEVELERWASAGCTTAVIRSVEDFERRIQHSRELS